VWDVLGSTATVFQAPLQGASQAEVYVTVDHKPIHSTAFRLSQSTRASTGSSLCYPGSQANP